MTYAHVHIHIKVKSSTKSSLWSQFSAELRHFSCQMKFHCCSRRNHVHTISWNTAQLIYSHGKLRIPSPTPIGFRHLNVSIFSCPAVKQSSVFCSVLVVIYFTVYRSTYGVSFQCTNMHKSTSGFYLYLRRFSRASIL